jgi:hypothetical protein
VPGAQRHVGPQRHQPVFVLDREHRAFPDSRVLRKRALDELLSSDVVCAIVDEEVGAYRERVYPPLTTLGLFIGQALCADGACQDAVARHLSECTALGAARCSLSSGPYCKARQRLALSLIERLAVSVGERLEDISCKNWKWRGRSVKLLDGTTISMPDTAANQMDPATYARMPQQLSLRQTEVAGRVLVTTLTDARSVAPLDLDALYRSRWQVERSAFDQSGNGYGHLAREVTGHDRQGDCC